MLEIMSEGINLNDEKERLRSPHVPEAHKHN
jgi:hypothetical protein